MGQADLLLDANAEPHAWGATGELGTDGRTGAPPAGAHAPPPATGASGLEARIQLQCVKDGSRGGDLLLDATAGPHGQAGTGEPGMDGRIDVPPAEARGSSYGSSPAAGADGFEARIQLEGGLPDALLVDAAGPHGRTGVAGSEPAPADSRASDLMASEGPDARVLGKGRPTDARAAARRTRQEGGVPDARLTIGVGTTVPATAVMRDALHRTPIDAVAVAAAVIAITAAPAITHHHPVITIMSSPSRHHYHRPACEADLLGVEP